MCGYSSSMPDPLLLHRALELTRGRPIFCRHNRLRSTWIPYLLYLSSTHTCRVCHDVWLSTSTASRGESTHQPTTSSARPRTVIRRETNMNEYFFCASSTLEANQRSPSCFSGMPTGSKYMHIVWSTTCPCLHQYRLVCCVDRHEFNRHRDREIYPYLQHPRTVSRGFWGISYLFHLASLLS